MATYWGRESQRGTDRTNYRTLCPAVTHRKVPPSSSLQQFRKIRIRSGAVEIKRPIVEKHDIVLVHAQSKDFWTLWPRLAQLVGQTRMSPVGAPRAGARVPNDEIASLRSEGEPEICECIWILGPQLFEERVGVLGTRGQVLSKKG